MVADISPLFSNFALTFAKNTSNIVSQGTIIQVQQIHLYNLQKLL